MLIETWKDCLNVLSFDKIYSWMRNMDGIKIICEVLCTSVGNKECQIKWGINNKTGFQK